MKVNVLKARMRWNTGWDNTPDVEVMVNLIPREWVYNRQELDSDRTLYHADIDGLVHFLLENKRDRTGALGIYEGLLKDGTRFNVGGCWSSNCQYVNGLGLYPPSMHVILTDKEEAWQKGYTFYGGYAMTLDKIEKEVWPVLDPAGGKPILIKQGNLYYLGVSEDTCQRCKGFGVDPRYKQDIRDCIRCKGTGKAPPRHMHPCATCNGAWSCRCYQPDATRFCCYPCEKGKTKVTEEGELPDHAPGCYIHGDRYVPAELSQEQIL